MLITLDNILTPEQGLSSVADQLGARPRANTLSLPSDVGEGEISNFKLLDGLVLSCMEFNFAEETTIERRAMRGSRQIPVIFYSRQFWGEQTVQDDLIKIGTDTPYGVFMPSSLVETRWIIPGGTWYFFVNLLFDRERMREFSGDGRSFLSLLLDSGKQFCVFEPLVPEMEHILEAIRDIVEEGACSRQARLHSLAMRLFAVFQERLEGRLPGNRPKGLDPSTSQAVFDVMRKIRSALPGSPSVAELARGAGLCVSKLQRSFKQVFGMSISECVMKERMEYARSLLAEGSMNVTEVGTKLGYVNLSHFSRAFKGHFGINPGEARKARSSPTAALRRRRP